MSKKGILRIVEATIAIMLLAGVLVTLQIQSTDKADESEYYYSLEVDVLREISQRPDMRNAVLAGDEILVSNFVNDSLPDNVGFELRICNLEAPTCPRNIQVGDVSVFAEESIISSNLTEYKPKRVKLYVWPH